MVILFMGYSFLDVLFYEYCGYVMIWVIRIEY